MQLLAFFYNALPSLVERGEKVLTLSSSCSVDLPTVCEISPNRRLFPFWRRNRSRCNNRSTFQIDICLRQPPTENGISFLSVLSLIGEWAWLWNIFKGKYASRQVRPFTSMAKKKKNIECLSIGISQLCLNGRTLDFSNLRSFYVSNVRFSNFQMMRHDTIRSYCLKEHGTILPYVIIRPYIYDMSL